MISTKNAVDAYRKGHFADPDQDMRVDRRRLYFSSCQWIAEHFIGADYPADRIAIGIDGDKELLTMLTAHIPGTTPDEFEITTDLNAVKPETKKYLVIHGTASIGMNNDDDVQKSILNSDAFIAGMDGYLMGPKGMALITINDAYLRENFQDPTISWDYNKSFQDRMSQLGSRDYATSYSAGEVVKNYFLMKFMFPDKMVGEKDGMYHKWNSAGI